MLNNFLNSDHVPEVRKVRRKEIENKRQRREKISMEIGNNVMVVVAAEVQAAQVAAMEAGVIHQFKSK